MSIYINGNSARCKHCLYFKETDVPENKRKGSYIYPGQEPDGRCSKIFPRGYTNAGRDGGYVWSGKHACWLIEVKP